VTWKHLALGGRIAASRQQTAGGERNPLKLRLPETAESGTYPSLAFAKGLSKRTPLPRSWRVLLVWVRWKPEIVAALALAVR
jgi:hypothetical protein